MLAATTSARIRSACMALPEVSISPKRFIAAPSPWACRLWTAVSSSQIALGLMLDSFPTPGLRLGLPSFARFAGCARSAVSCLVMSGDRGRLLQPWSAPGFQLLSAWIASITRWYSCRSRATPVLNRSCASARFRLSRSMETSLPSGRAINPSTSLDVHGPPGRLPVSPPPSPAASRLQSPCPRRCSPGVSMLAMLAAVSFASAVERSR